MCVCVSVCVCNLQPNARQCSCGMQDSLVLDVDDVCHVLTVETGGPIFSVAVQSGVLLDLEECPVAILSKSPPDPTGASLTLATYRYSFSPY